ncbi:dioxygenase [Pantoea sp. 18069]|uniref:dioxygenase n=1 Tax=Pantoea sp. 18069 TaxID=2681415 RepID=UPI00190F91B1|nr:dioxygenase [Pantoea sp. 18069]
MTIAAIEKPRHATSQGAIPANPQALLKAVLKANEGTKDQRTRELLDGLIRHIHAFATETRLTYEELHKGLDFMVAVGQATGPKKHEGILLADILGLATLVLLMDAKAVLAAGGTEPALIGPFWRANQPQRANGAYIASEDTVGSPLFVRGKVVSIDGTPIAGARPRGTVREPGPRAGRDEPACRFRNRCGRPFLVRKRTALRLWRSH